MGQPLVNGALYYHNGVPYTYQNGMAMFTADGQPIGGVVSPTTHTGNGLRGAEQFRDTSLDHSRHSVVYKAMVWGLGLDKTKVTQNVKRKQIYFVQDLFF